MMNGADLKVFSEAAGVCIPVLGLLASAFRLGLVLVIFFAVSGMSVYLGSSVYDGLFVWCGERCGRAEPRVWRWRFSIASVERREGGEGETGGGGGGGGRGLPVVFAARVLFTE